MVTDTEALSFLDLTSQPNVKISIEAIINIHITLTSNLLSCVIFHLGKHNKKWATVFSRGRRLSSKNQYIHPVNPGA